MKQQNVEHDAEIVFHKMNAVYKSLGLDSDSCFMASTLARAYSASDTDETTKIKEGADYLYDNIDMFKALMNRLNYVKNTGVPPIPKVDIPRRKI